MSESKALKKYAVYRRKTGKLLVKGTAMVCADALDISYASFLTMVSRSAKGRGTYMVEVQATTPGRSADKLAMEKWNRLVYIPGLVRKEQRDYPCRCCAHRSLCVAMDVSCALWRRGYSAAYDRAAKRLEIAAAEGGEDVD